MRVRLKPGALYPNPGGHFPPPVFEVVEESPNFYIVHGDELTGLEPVPKRYWEPVPADTWLDITGECVNHNDPSILHQNGAFICELPRGYRFQKVNLLNPGDGLGTYRGQWAFIVERKETP